MSQNANIKNMTKEELETALIYANDKCFHIFCEKEKLKLIVSSPSLLRRDLDNEREITCSLKQEISRLKRVIIGQKRLIRFGHYKFPNTKRDDNGDTSDVCLCCGLWCSDKYYYVEGNWILSPDEEPPVPIVETNYDPENDETIYSHRITICRDCSINIDGDSGEIISVLGREFVIDYMFRPND